MIKIEVAKLVATLGFDIKNAKLREFTDLIGEMNLSSLLSAAGLLSVQQAIKKIMDTSDRAAVNMKTLTTETGISGKSLQQFMNFSEQMGVDSNTAAASVKALQSAMLKLRMGEGNARPFAFLGLDPNQNVFSTIEKIRKNIVGYSPEIQRALLSELGISENMLMVLKATDSQWESIGDQVYNSESDYSKIMEYHAEINKLSQNFKASIIEIGAFLSPIGADIASLFSWMMKLVKESDLLKGALIVIGTTLAILVAANPFGVFVVGITAVIAWSAILKKHWQGIKELFFEIVEKIPKLSFPKLGLSGASDVPGIPLKFAGAIGAASMVTNHNSITMHISGDNVEQQVEQGIKKAIGNATYQRGNAGSY